MFTSNKSIPDQTFDPIAYEKKRAEVYQQTINEEKYANSYLEAREADAAMNTDLVYAGEFDGVIGLDANPEFWGKSDSYEHGYLTGVRKRFNKLYKVELAVEPF